MCNEIVIFTTEDGKVSLDVQMENETFPSSVVKITISLHIIYLLANTWQIVKIGRAHV